MAEPGENRYHAADALDTLQILDEEERRQKISCLLDDNDTAQIGIMLFKYHFIGNSSAAATPSTDLAADVVFSRLTQEQKRFWATETMKLALGQLIPLYHTTFSTFLNRFPEAVINEQHDGEKSLPDEPQTPKTPQRGRDDSDWSSSLSAGRSQRSPHLDSGSPASSCPSPLANYGQEPDLDIKSNLPPVHRLAHDTKLIFTTADQRQIDQYPILDFICKGRPLNKMFNEKIITRILRFLEKRIQDHPESNIVGRYRGMQLNYDPGAVNVRSIKARLNASLTRKVFVDEACEPVKDILTEFEALMRPLVAWNREFWTMSEFAHLKMPGEGDNWTYTDDYDSCIDWFVGEHEHLLPVSQDNKDEVVEALIGCLMEKASMHPNHPLVKYSPFDSPHLLSPLSKKNKGFSEKLKRFSLKNCQTGFATELKSCFDREDLRSDEYLDLLEQKLYQLHREFPALNLKEAHYWA